MIARGLSTVAIKTRYCRPQFDRSPKIKEHRPREPVREFPLQSSKAIISPVYNARDMYITKLPTRRTELKIFLEFERCSW